MSESPFERLRQLAAALLALACAGGGQADACGGSNAAAESTVPDVPPIPHEAGVPVPAAIRLANGLEVRLLPATPVPLVTVSIVLRSGSASDPPGKEGLAALAAGMLDEGAGARGALELAEALDFLGAELSIATTRDYTSITLQVLEERLEPALDILADVLLRPRFEEEDWERVHTLALHELRQRQEEPVLVARVAGDRAFYGDGHPYAHPPDGYVASLRAITRGDVQTFYLAHVRPERAVVLASGPAKMPALRALLEKRFGEWKVPGEPPPLPEVKPAPPSKQRLLAIEKPGAPQTVIRIYVPGPAFGSPMSVPLALADTVFGGTFTSRLNANLREDKKITYGARSGFAELARAGHGVAVTSVEAPATALALAELHREIRAMGRGDLREDEIEKAKSTQRSRVIQSLETQAGILGLYLESAAFGRPPGERQTFYETLMEVSRENVAAAAKDTFRWDRALIVLVGDGSTIRRALETLAGEAGRSGVGALPELSLPAMELRDREGG